jgi:hypothetical protein
MNEWAAAHSNFVMQSEFAPRTPARRAWTMIRTARQAALRI